MAFSAIICDRLPFPRQAAQRRARTKDVDAAGESQGTDGAAGAADDASQGPVDAASFLTTPRLLEFPRLIPHKMSQL